MQLAKPDESDKGDKLGEGVGMVGAAVCSLRPAAGVRVGYADRSGGKHLGDAVGGPLSVDRPRAWAARDGGAVAADGTQEKDLNLSIGLLLRDMLRIMGYEVRMTRTEDISIHSPDCNDPAGAEGWGYEKSFGHV